MLTVLHLGQKVSKFKTLNVRVLSSFFQLLACGNRGQSTIECWRYDVSEKWTFFNSFQRPKGERDPFVAVSLDTGILAFSGGIYRWLPKGSKIWESGTTPNHIHFSHSCAVAISGQSFVRKERLDNGFCRTLQIICFRY